jgi:hypothetical protein
MYKYFKKVLIPAQLKHGKHLNGETIFHISKVCVSMCLELINEVTVFAFIFWVSAKITTLVIFVEIRRRRSNRKPLFSKKVLIVGQMPELFTLCPAINPEPISNIFINPLLQDTP